MQYSTIALALFAAVAAAQNSTSLPDLVESLPPCAIPCFQDGADAAGCSTTDFTCLCANQSSFITGALTCVISDCQGDELNTLTSVATQICEAVAANPNASAVASASAIVTSALGAASATTSADADSAAFRPAMGLGFLGAAVAAAMMTL
ncbi:hypothetical protein GGS24DRAFT_108070 [Hypoxylon argillaceum]|nr:hypothetical protein GGS24DRAFT_108070 [Hypoxylon argillaceum]KAI1150022.1 hypothetical protein F4825DRAFT_428230 [Nemania diffusa]